MYNCTYFILLAYMHINEQLQMHPLENWDKRTDNEDAEIYSDHDIYFLYIPVPDISSSGVTKNLSKEPALPTRLAPTPPHHPAPTPPHPAPEIATAPFSSKSPKTRRLCLYGMEKSSEE